jgi:hypothetical protein
MCQRGWRRGEKINTEGSPHSKITVFDERDHNIVGYIEASVTFFSIKILLLETLKEGIFHARIKGLSTGSNQRVCDIYRRRR